MTCMNPARSFPRVDISGELKLPSYPVVFGYDANLGQYMRWFGGDNIDTLNKPGNDVRFYFGLKFQRHVGSQENRRPLQLTHPHLQAGSSIRPALSHSRPTTIISCSPKTNATASTWCSTRRATPSIKAQSRGRLIRDL